MPTTVKVSPETRDRLKALSNGPMEATIIEALDLLEAQRFWKQAEVAAAWRQSLPEERRAELAADEAALQAALDGIE